MFVYIYRSKFNMCSFWSKKENYLTLIKIKFMETGNRWSVYTSLYRLFCNEIRIKLGVFVLVDFQFVGVVTFRKVILTILGLKSKKIVKVYQNSISELLKSIIRFFTSKIRNFEKFFKVSRQIAQKKNVNKL